MDVARLCASKISQGDYALMVTRQNPVIAMVAACDLVLALQGGSVTPPLLPSRRGEAVRAYSNDKNLPYALWLCTADNRVAFQPGIAGYSGYHGLGLGYW